MNDLPQQHSLGLEFFRFPDLLPLSADGYFKCLNALRPLFKAADFADSTPRFYINRITNVDDDQGNSLRLTYEAFQQTESGIAVGNARRCRNEIPKFPKQE